MDIVDRKSGHKKIENLVLLRFILAFLTMAWHYYYFGPKAWEIQNTPLDFFGFRYLSFTVEVFFIISGFIIIASAIDRSAIDFLIGRIVRLGPCLLVCATFTYLSAFVAGHVAPSSSYLASIFIFPLAFHDGMDGVYWSLRFEVIFYAFIFVAACLVDVRKNIFRIALLLTAYDWLVFLVLMFLEPNPGDLGDVRYSMGEYASFFSIGMLLYLIIVEKKLNVALGATLAAACALAGIRCYRIANIIAHLTHESRVSVLTGFCLLAVVVTVFLAFVRTEQRPALARIYSKLGKTSYPLYLVHQNVGYAALRFFQNRLHVHADLRPFVIIAMVVLAWGVAHHAEPALASWYRRSLAKLVDASRLVRARVLGSKRTFGDAE